MICLIINKEQWRVLWIENLSLQDVVDIQHLLYNVSSQIWLKFSVVTTDIEGRPITALNNFQSFRKLIRSTEKVEE